jgi:BMFP domain-containing protein YqiC
MQKKIETYVTPDLTEFDKRLAVVEENTNKVNDYTRDIKNDIKNDVRRLEKIVEQVERDGKQMSREVDKDLREMRKETDNKIRRALDNPLATKE